MIFNNEIISKLLSKVDNNRNMKREKTGGRKAGTPNKTSIEIRQAFNELISSKLPELSKWLDQVAKDNPEKAQYDIVSWKTVNTAEWNGSDSIHVLQPNS